MFFKEYSFVGKHAKYVQELTDKYKIENNEGVSIFNRNIDVYIFASIVGCVYGKRSEIDKSLEYSNIIKKIATSQLLPEADRIIHCYEMLMLLHNKNEDDINTRIERAFKYHNRDEKYKKECFDIFNSYILGGVEILHEKIIAEGRELEDFMLNLYDFIEEFNIKYNKSLDDDEFRISI